MVIRRRRFLRNRSGQKAETGSVGRGDGHVGGRQYAADEGDGRHQAVHHTFVFRHETGAGDRRVPVGVQADGDEEPAGEEGGQVGVGTGAVALRRTLRRTLSRSVRDPVVVRTVPGTTAAAAAAVISTATYAVRPVRTATASTSVYAVERIRRRRRRGRRRHTSALLAHKSGHVPARDQQKSAGQQVGRVPWTVAVNGR